MEINASQVESIVRDVLAQMSVGGATKASGDIPKTARVAMLTAPKTIEVKEYPIPPLGDDERDEEKLQPLVAKFKFHQFSWISPLSFAILPFFLRSVPCRRARAS